MKLDDRHGRSLALEIRGYQFPHLATAEHDSNWLDVDVAVAEAGKAWRRVDPCLLTYEAAALRSWLVAVALGRTPNRLWFTEPNLSFEVSRGAGTTPEVRAFLSHECRPPWAPEDLEDDYFMAFPVRRVQLLLAALSLQTQLLRFPQRARV